MVKAYHMQDSLANFDSEFSSTDSLEILMKVSSDSHVPRYTIVIIVANRRSAQRNQKSFELYNYILDRPSRLIDDVR